MSGNVHARSAAEEDTLRDAEAMLAAAESDDAVKKRLGPKFLATMKDGLARARALSGDKSNLDHAKIAEGARVLALATDLLTTMREIRDAAQLSGLSDADQRALGKGHDWKASSPETIEHDAEAMARVFHEHPKLATESNIDKQHLHDLVEGAQAIKEAHGRHRTLAQDRKDDTAARAHEMATLRAEAHHVRLAARVLHRREPGKLAHFESPVPRHRIVHRAQPADATPPKG